MEGQKVKYIIYTDQPPSPPSSPKQVTRSPRAVVGHVRRQRVSCGPETFTPLSSDAELALSSSISWSTDTDIPRTSSSTSSISEVVSPRSLLEQALSSPRTAINADSPRSTSSNGQESERKSAKTRNHDHPKRSKNERTNETPSSLKGSLANTSSSDRTELKRKVREQRKLLREALESLQREIRARKELEQLLVESRKDYAEVASLLAGANEKLLKAESLLKAQTDPSSLIERLQAASRHSSKNTKSRKHRHQNEEQASPKGASNETLQAVMENARPDENPSTGSSDTNVQTALPSNAPLEPLLQPQKVEFVMVDHVIVKDICAAPAVDVSSSTEVPIEPGLYQSGIAEQPDSVMYIEEVPAEL